MGELSYATEVKDNAFVVTAINRKITTEEQVQFIREGRALGFYTVFEICRYDFLAMVC